MDFVSNKQFFYLYLYKLFRVVLFFVKPESNEFSFMKLPTEKHMYST